MKLKILLVEDELMIREMLSEELAASGHEVIEACNAKDALEKLGKAEIHAVVSDIRMPNGDGFELVRQLREVKGLSVPIILISGLAELKPAELQAIGVNHFFLKPFRFKDLLRQLESSCQHQIQL